MPLRLSRHFDLETLSLSETAAERGIDNVPSDPRVIENLGALCEAILEPFATDFNLPVAITSGYRGPELNRVVGGRADSQHLTGEAVDFLVGGLQCDQVALWIAANLDFDELILEKFDLAKGEHGWVHCSFSRSFNRGKTTTFDGEDYHDGLVAVGVREDRLSTKVLNRTPFRRF